MNIEQFKYEQTPFFKIRKYEIMPLSDEGFNKYTNKESYTHQYLYSLSPARAERIYQTKEKVQEVMLPLILTSE